MPLIRNIKDPEIGIYYLSSLFYLHGIWNNTINTIIHHKKLFYELYIYYWVHQANSIES